MYKVPSVYVQVLRGVSIQLSRFTTILVNFKTSRTKILVPTVVEINFLQNFV